MTGQEIKKLRKHLRMSRRRFGIRLGEVLGQKPIIRTTIERWETGNVKPHDKFLKALDTIRIEYEESRKVKMIVEALNKLSEVK